MPRASAKPLPFSRFSDRLFDGVCHGFNRLKADPKPALRPVTFLAIVGGAGLAIVCAINAGFHTFDVKHMRTQFFEAHKDVLLRSVDEIPENLRRSVSPPELGAAGPLSMQQTVVARRMWRCVNRRSGESGRYWTEQSLERACADELVSDATLAGGETRGKDVVATLNALQFVIPTVFRQ
ncbi:hypothetical protein R70006_06268 [Paraburkholderia domus]|nr:hypothetical protein R70006_06268 [Paraburkholderia domus]